MAPGHCDQRSHNHKEQQPLLNIDQWPGTHKLNSLVTQDISHATCSFLFLLRRVRVIPRNHKNATARNGKTYNKRSHRPKPGGVASTLESASPPPCELCRTS